MRLLFITVFMLLAVFLSGSQKLIAQSYVADTLAIPLDESPSINFQKPLSAKDFRNEAPRFISVFEKKKGLVFPVDQIVVTPKPLTHYFSNEQNANNKIAYQLGIHDFYLNYGESYFKKYLKLNAYIELSQITAQADTTYLGIFYYEQQNTFTRKDSLTQCYQTAWDKFSIKFYNDLNSITQDTLQKLNPSLYHFRRGQHAAPKNFFISTDWYYGYTFWGFDAEIWFSDPEMAQLFKRNTRMFRYLNFGNRQSVAFSAGVSLYNKRLNDRWLFQNKHAFIFGLNKWNDVDEAKRTFEELFLFQYTFMQRLTFNPINKSGLVFGVGLMEEASYIIYNEPIFSVGATLHCAYKF